MHMLAGPPRHPHPAHCLQLPRPHLRLLHRHHPLPRRRRLRHRPLPSLPAHHPLRYLRLVHHPARPAPHLHHLHPLRRLHPPPLLFLSLRLIPQLQVAPPLRILPLPAVMQA